MLPATAQGAVVVLTVQKLAHVELLLVYFVIKRSAVAVLQFE